jgi:hypothetical protein
MESDAPVELSYVIVQKSVKGFFNRRQQWVAVLLSWSAMHGQYMVTATRGPFKTAEEADAEGRIMAIRYHCKFRESKSDKV